jgi:chromate transporter
VTPPGEASPSDGPSAVPLSTAFAYWVRLGFTSFGGPAGQIAIMHRDLVAKRRWISEDRFLHALNYCMLLPGPEAQQLAIYIGWLLNGTVGGLLAGAFFVLPSIAILWGLSAAYAAWGTVPAVAGLLSGVKPVVVALVLSAVIRIGRRAFRPTWLVAIAAASFVAILFFHVPFPAVILGAAMVAAAVDTVARPLPGSFEASGGSSSRDREARPARTLAPGNPIVSRGPWARATRIVGAGLVLWGAPLAIVVAVWGPHSLFAEEYRFFTKAALVTFGGAYAVLAYVTQAAVESFRWITHAQAVDGMGLAETTPGPLIMVLQFVGFMAAWNHPVTGNRLASATVGALVTTWVTFLPCFVFVFLGAPYIEGLRTRPTLAAALKGVGAAVVGVILNLGVVFGLAVVFPSGLRGPLDLFAAIVAAASFLLLTRTRVEAVWIVLAGAAAGLLFRLLGP